MDGTTRTSVRIHNRTRALALLGAAGLAVVAGCRTGGIANPIRGVLSSGTTFSPDDFVAADGEAAVRRPAASGVAVEHAAADDHAGGTETTGAEQPSQPVIAATIGERSTGNPGGGRLVTTPGPAIASADARAVGAEQLVNAKVGDLNGRPVFVDEFFEPIAARLIAEAEKRPRRQWEAFAGEQIARRLNGMLQDELLRSEALASLSPELRRQGVRNFVDRLRQQYVSRNQGSEQQLRRNLQETEGKTLEAVLREQQESALVGLTVARDLRQRVNVSWRDIVQRYERDSHIYNPPPTAVFRVVRVRTSDAESLEAVRSMLVSGTSFVEIAESEHNDFNKDEGGVQAGPVGEEGFGETQFFGRDELNELAWSLTPGAHGGPVEFGSQTAWIMLERIERESIPLYEAQLTIAEELYLELLLEEQNRYVGRLVERARVTNVQQTLERLYAIAIERYAPSDG